MISENELNGSIEYYEEVIETVVSDNSLNEEILEELRGLRKDVQGFTNSTFSVSVSNLNVSDNEVVHDVSGNTVSSNNILNTPLNEYGLTDSMLALSLVTALIVGLILIVRKAVYKWS